METHDDLNDLIHRCRQLPVSERETLLRETIADEAERKRLSSHLEKMLESDAFIGDAMSDRGYLGIKGQETSGFSEREGDQVGAYVLRQIIGEGGFGVVWMAEQSKPIARMVALKVVKAGMDTRQVLARFEAERQALALMDHTHIARVLDAGSTSSGRPYFAMELVKGIPITEFCREQKLNLNARLALFQDVCSAVNHAHQKGIIHRDLKPSNVLVTLEADKPVAKVIDFGIAKATQNKLTEKTLFTRFEQFLGTPVYMSPEQAAMSNLDIDTRSDIYSLGVLLYELLAGQPPFDSKTLLSAGYDEMRRIIREVEPPRPSTRLTEGPEGKAALQRLHVNAKAIKGELDWIVMKAMEKNRSQRYETANAFAADINRYLSDEPVRATAPTPLYKFRKFALRHRAALGTAAAIFLLLLAATCVSTWLALRALEAESLAEQHLEESRYNEGRSWMLRAEVAEKEGKRYPDTLFYAARAIGFEDHRGSEPPSDEWARLIREDLHPQPFRDAKRWIQENGLYLPVWRSAPVEKRVLTTRLAVDSDGRRLASRTEDGAGRIWDFTNPEQNPVLLQPSFEGYVRDLAFHPSGERLAMAHEDRIRFWYIESQSYEEELAGEVLGLDYSPSGSLLAGTARDGVLLVWENDSGAPLQLDTGQSSSASRLAFSADESMLAAVFPGVGVKIYSFGSGGEEGHWLPMWENWGTHHPESAAEASSAVFSPDMTTLAIGMRGGNVSLFEVATAQKRGESKLQGAFDGEILDLDYRSDGKRLAGASADGVIRVWSLDHHDLSLEATLMNTHAGTTCVDFIPGGMTLAIASRQGQIVLWDVSGRKEPSLDLHRYFSEGWYSFDRESQKLNWKEGAGFLDLTGMSVWGPWPGGPDSGEDLFSRFLQSESWEAAQRWASKASSSARQERVADALLEHAHSAADQRHWRQARLCLERWRSIGPAASDDRPAEVLAERLPGTAGLDFEVEDGIDMVWCQPGTFFMGSPETEAGHASDTPLKKVTLDSGFWIGKQEITVAQYRKLMDPHASKDANASAGRLPATEMTSFEAIDYCRRLTEREIVRGTIPPGWRFHLPTESQWEYACRGGSQTAFCFGDDDSLLGNYAWYSGNSEDQPRPVGMKHPNAWGVYDMHGNVFEWCRDIVGGDGLPRPPSDGKEAEDMRIFRGGCFNREAVALRSANRLWAPPNVAYTVLGFRVALVPVKAPSERP